MHVFDSPTHHPVDEVVLIKPPPFFHARPTSSTKPTIRGQSDHADIGLTPADPGEATYESPSTRLVIQEQEVRRKMATDAPQRPVADYAFAFDIDGVLVRGKQYLKGAREALEKLQKQSVPFILLTNGGGLTEENHVAKVGQRLSLTLEEDQFVQSHTPFKQLLPKYQNDWILAIGGSGDHVRNLAKAYGFTKVMIPSDVTKHHPSLHPFPEMTKAHHDEFGQQHEDYSHHPRIAAILVWSTPRDWCLDIQVIMDLLLSKDGRLGTVSEKNGDTSLPNKGYQQDGQPTVHFCNPDLVWSTDYGEPRLAQGAFRQALEGVWGAETGAELQAWSCGKPTSTTYRYAEAVIKAYQTKLNGPAATVKRIYMVGDNPASDIQGARRANEESEEYEWKGILVESGVFKSGRTPAFEPDVICADVLEAVEWAIEQETGCTKY